MDAAEDFCLISSGTTSPDPCVAADVLLILQLEYSRRTLVCLDERRRSSGVVENPFAAPKPRRTEARLQDDYAHVARSSGIIAIIDRLS